MLLTQLLATAFVIIGTGFMIVATVLYAYIVITRKDFNSWDCRDVIKIILITLISFVFVATVSVVVEHFKHLIS